MERAIVIPMPTVLGKINLDEINQREQQAKKAKRVFINESREKAEEFKEEVKKASDKHKEKKIIHETLVRSFSRRPGATLTDAHGHLVIKLS